MGNLSTLEFRDSGWLDNEHRSVVLDPAKAVLLRPDRSIQFGVHPETAVVLPLPAAIEPVQALHVFLQARVPLPPDDLVRTLTYCGFEAAPAASVIDELLRTRILLWREVSRAVPILRLGKPAVALSDALVNRHVEPNWVDLPGGPATGNARHISTSQGRLLNQDVLLLAGGLFPPRDVQFWLHEQAIAHYPTGIVDGRLAFGPLVVPGKTACLSCIDHSYLEVDMLWQSTRAQAVSRPAGSQPSLRRMAVELAANITVERLLPWRDSGMQVAAIPEFLQHRQFFDPQSLSLTTEPVRTNDACFACRMSNNAAS